MSVQVETAIAVVTALRSDPVLTGLLPVYAGVPQVFTHVPQKVNNKYPYVVLYDAGFDNTDNSEGVRYDGTLNLHTWSDSRDLSTIGNIQKAIFNALHNKDISISDYGLVELHQEFTTILRDPDGITMHGVQRFRIMLEDEA